jgi:hypothetical protein
MNRREMILTALGFATGGDILAKLANDVDNEKVDNRTLEEKAIYLLKLTFNSPHTDRPLLIREVRLIIDAEKATWAMQELIDESS